jgi:hypothetical protein
MRTTVPIAALACALLLTAGCKQESNYPAAEATTTAVVPVPGPTETQVVGVPVPGPTETQTTVVTVPVPGPTVTETAAPKASPSPN